MNQILQNIKDGTVFSPKRCNNEMLRNIHYVSKKTSRSAMVSDFKKALGAYKQIHKLS